MNTDLLVMAVTRLSDGVCVACLDQQNRWVRPTQENARGWRQLTVGHLKDRTGRLVVQPGNLIRWDLGRPIPRDVHTEDVLVGNESPTLLRALPPDEFRRRCEAVEDPSLASFLRGTDQSLTLIRPQSIGDIQFLNEGKGNLKSRMRITHGGHTEHRSAMDLYWRALGRQVLTKLKSPSVLWTPRALLHKTGLAIESLVIGRGQAYEAQNHPLAGAYWPLIVGVLTHPPNTTAVDYSNL